MLELLPNWHPVFVKFGYALSVSGALAGAALCLGLRPLRTPLSHFTQFALAIGAAALALAVVSGFWAFATVPVDTVAARAAMEVHRAWALVGATVAIVVAAATLAAPGLLDKRAWALALLTPVILLSRTAALGAEVVYRHGVGVLS